MSNQSIHDGDLRGSKKKDRQRERKGKITRCKGAKGIKQESIKKKKHTSAIDNLKPSPLGRAFW